ncbi:hypothetical protein [Prosthecobacter sp.]|jgi:hypothetical protein|uniref:hypothetical protein n=1 Tax=Prosthecobacter sp. TaxID=1965333 RepID=UPI003784B123
MKTPESTKTRHCNRLDLSRFKALMTWLTECSPAVGKVSFEALAKEASMALQFRVTKANCRTALQVCKELELDRARGGNV